ncbi:hypothetical protein [Clostridium cellulovorans]|uniref:Uncharacterized protein n=1 Tax=Clostridium cellulovorans (strain ATCC 35296 / DSM 3052 / OCM 3 / 743B) TaxID=573061 RepID=D9SL71_CLOC7|nr:hypothetical protein [Clostridium cellulovorans]ADL51587.1 hypothetical protein Clocel_1843 [Clostridium cellulovorans 743B]
MNTNSSSVKTSKNIIKDETTTKKILGSFPSNCPKIIDYFSF